MVLIQELQDEVVSLWRALMEVEIVARARNQMADERFRVLV